jgi:HEPN domain-containing protein
MKPITTEWVGKAEGDFAMMEREVRARKNRNHDGIWFHAQQCAEKYLKGVFVEAKRAVPRSHDLTALLDDVVDLYPHWEDYRIDLAYLSDFAVAYRYPGESADRTAALDARKKCRRFWRAARDALGLSG